MVVQAGQILSAARLNSLVSGFQASIDAKLSGFVKHKSADTTRASTTTFSADPHLVATVAANTRYTWLCHFIYQAAATPQIKFQASFPSGTMDASSWEYDPGTDDWQASLSVSGSSPISLVSGLIGTGGNVPGRFSGSLVTGISSGTFSLDWAQNVSNASGTILRKGSWMLLIPTN